MLRRLAPLAVALAACSSKAKDPAPAAAADARAQVAAKIDAGAAVAKPVEPTPEPPPPKVALTKDQQKAYKDGLKQGRALTKSAEYTEAISAFDRALAVIENDPRAMGERGYARLLAEDWAAARKDVEKALAGTKDGKLQGALWYNLGLIAEGEGELEASKRAFFRSNALRPSKAAAAKIASGPVCLAEIARDPGALPDLVSGIQGKSPGKPGEVAGYTSWLTMFTELTDPDDAPATAPKTDDEARAALCGTAGCSGAGPWVVKTGGDYPSYSVAVPSGDEIVVFRDLAEGDEVTGWSMCDSGPEPIRPELANGRLHVHVVDISQMPYSYCMDDDDGSCEYEAHDCSESLTASDYYFDVASRRLLLYVGRNLIGGEGGFDGPPSEPELPKSEADERPEVKAEVKADGLQLKGGGCDQLVPFAAP